MTRLEEREIWSVYKRLLDNQIFFLRVTTVVCHNSNSTMSGEGWVSYMSSLLGARHMTHPLRVQA